MRGSLLNMLVSIYAKWQEHCMLYYKSFYSQICRNLYGARKVKILKQCDGMIFCICSKCGTDSGVKENDTILGCKGCEIFLFCLLWGSG